jgi:hypothetical protein
LYHDFIIFPRERLSTDCREALGFLYRLITVTVKIILQQSHRGGNPGRVSD